MQLSGEYTGFRTAFVKGAKENETFYESLFMYYGYSGSSWSNDAGSVCAGGSNRTDSDAGSFG